MTAADLHTALEAAITARRCAIEGCEKRSTGKHCPMHQSRKFKTGSYGPPGTVLLTPEERFWSKVEKSDTCWLWTGARTSRGYGNMSIRQQPVLVHRYSYQLANGPIPAGLVVMHSCDNPPCVNPAHLSAGTHGDNAADKCRKGRHAHVITAEILDLVLSMRRAGVTYAVIAEQIGRSVESTKKIVNRKARLLDVYPEVTRP